MRCSLAAASLLLISLERASSLASPSPTRRTALKKWTQTGLGWGLATAVGIGHPPVARAIDPSTTRLAVTSRVYLDLASEGESIGRLDVEVTREEGGRACCAHRSRPPLPPPPPNLPENTTTP